MYGTCCGVSSSRQSDGRCGGAQADPPPCASPPVPPPHSRDARRYVRIFPTGGGHKMVPGADGTYGRDGNGSGTGGRIERVLPASSARAILPPGFLPQALRPAWLMRWLVSRLSSSPARRASSASSCGRTLAGFRGAGSILHTTPLIESIHTVLYSPLSKVIEDLRRSILFLPRARLRRRPARSTRIFLVLFARSRPFAPSSQRMVRSTPAKLRRCLLTSLEDVIRFLLGFHIIFSGTAGGPCVPSPGPRVQFRFPV